MPLELQIIRASEFIRLGARGRLDLAASREILRQLAGACQRRGINQALLDLRDVRPGSTPMLTPGDLAALVNAFCGMGFSDKLRLAVLYSADPYRRARQFAFLTRLRGWNVKASHDFEEALFWLSQTEPAAGRKEAGEKEVPVRRPKDRRQVEEQKIPTGLTRRSDVLPVRSRLRAETSRGKATPPPHQRHSHPPPRQSLP